MQTPEEWKRRRSTFPPAMRRLVDAELRAGNRIVQIASAPPAPDFGAFVRLAKPVRTLPRQSQGELHFRVARGADYSGEWSDLCRHFFVLEPPAAPPPPEAAPARSEPKRGVTGAPSPADRSRAGTSDLVRRFEASQQLTYERWREGESYALELLAVMSPEERSTVEQSLAYSDARDWRQVEALAALRSPAAEQALRRAFGSDDPTVRTAVVRYAPHLVSEAERIAHLLDALPRVDHLAGLSEIGEEIRSFHPPVVLEAVQAALLVRPGSVAATLARLLLEVHGLAKDLFDPEQRAFLLRFTTEDPGTRRAVLAELRAMLARGER